jgi:hypothetical protein
MKLLGLGHSHIVAIASGCYALQDKGVKVGAKALTSRFIYFYEPSFMPTLLGEPQHSQLNPDLVALIKSERPDAILLCVHGNEHIALSVVRRHEPIDFILGESPELALEEGATLLTEAAIRETLRDKMAETFAIVAAVRRATSAPLVCIEPPPPLPDAQILAYPKEFFRKAVDAARLSPERFRHKVWRVQSALYREMCAANDIAFVAVPQRFIAPPGVLAREAWGADATHANAVFGAAMVEQAIGFLESARA